MYSPTSFPPCRRQNVSFSSAGFFAERRCGDQGFDLSQASAGLPPVTFCRGRVNGQLRWDALPFQRQDRFWRVGRCFACFAVLEEKSGVEEKNFDILGAFREQVDFDLRVTPGSAIERAAGQIGSEFIQQAHQPYRRPAHVGQPFREFLALIQSLPTPQFCLDFGIGRQVSACAFI